MTALPDREYVTLEEVRAYLGIESPDWGYRGEPAKQPWRVKIPGVGIRIKREPFLRWLKAQEN